MLILFLILLLVCGGGFWRYPDYREHFGGGFGLLVMVLIVLFFMGRL
jgi:hypothetical protein